ncbi:MAG: hypothetical protein AAGA56_06665 [Myxococcota bacterium]
MFTRRNNRWFGLLLAASVATSVVACGGDKKDKSAKEDKGKKDEGKDKKDEKDKDKDAKKKDDKAAASAKPAADEPAGMVATKAATHLPDGCEVVVHVDISKILGAPNLKEAVASLQTAIDKTKEKDKDDPKSFTAFMADAKFDPLKDLKSTAVCMNEIEAKPKATFAVAGEFKAETMLASFEKTTKEKDVKREKVGDVDALSMDNGGMYIAAAPDGILVGTANKDKLASLMEPGTAHEAYKLPEAPVSVVFGKDLVQKKMKEAGKGGKKPFETYAEKVERAALTMDPATGEVKILFTLTDEKSAIEFGGFLKPILPEIASSPGLGGGPMKGIMGKLTESATIDNQGPELSITMKLPDEMMQGMMKQATAGLPQ